MKWQERDKIFSIVNKINRYRIETNIATLRVPQMKKEKDTIKEAMVFVDNTIDGEKVFRMIKAHAKERKVDFYTACCQVSYEISEKIRKGVAV